jgi:amino acid adenylation domain-containing protein
MNSEKVSGSLTQRKLQLLDSLLAAQGEKQIGDRAVPRRQELRQFPLSFAQQRLWFLDQLEPGPQYHDPFHLRLSGRLDLEALQAALSEIVRRHEALRASFDVLDGRPWQRILPHANVPVPLLDLSMLPAAEREERALQVAFEEGRREFKLHQGPLFRAKLLRLGPAEHVLLMTFHHIAMDGWSRTVFLREWASLYEAFVQGRPSPLPDLTIQYADFAAWQRERMSGGAFEQDLAFWKDQLRGIPALLEWPADFPRPASQSFRGSRQELRISRGLTEQLLELSRREGCTLFMTLLAAVQTLAMRHTRLEDVVVGCPIANRNRSEVEGLIGYFLNTLVLRARLSGEPGFREALQRTRETALAAYAHQDLPYERLVEELHPTRDPSYNSVFQTMFIFQNTPPPPTHAGGLKITPFDAHNGTAKFDLTLNLSETADGLAGWIEYATDLFRPDSIRRLCARFELLLEGVVRNPEQPITLLPLLPEAEARLFQQWNDTCRDFRSELCIHELFEIQAARTPAAIAAVFENSQITYQSLELRVNDLARRLANLGVQPESLVGIYLERSLDMVVAVLAVLKAGGAYVPLDPSLPPERLAFILEDSQLQVLITQPGLAQTLGDLATKQPAVELSRAIASGVGGDLVLLDFRLADPAPVLTTPDLILNRPNPQNLAYVIYTSGSTGKPKGVEVPHRAVVNILEALRTDLGITAADTWLAVTTLSFDIAALELLLPLVAGARVVIASREAATEGARLAGELKRSNATVMQATPATWRLLLAAGWAGNPRLKVLCGGEAWPAKLARSLLERCASVWNMYGPTETTIWSAVQRIDAEGNTWIGKPVANTRFYALDHRLQPVPIGVAGELCIAGEGLARGYWRRPELSAEKFVAGPEGRLYKSGDLVRVRDNGTMEFLGRIDHQVKVRGHRIETEEVEALLARHPSVRECAVVARPDASGENRLLAYLVTQGRAPGKPSEWRRYLSGKLPDYMAPSLFVSVPELPRTPNGKINRSQLPAPTPANGERSEEAPTTLDPVHAQLTTIWCEVLGVASVGVDDNFFDLGGHSLMVTQAIARIRQTFEVELPMRRFFEAPTISGIAAGISTSQHSSVAEP